MIRSLSLACLVVAGCRPESRPTAPMPAPPVSAKPAFAKTLAGPYRDLAAYCAARPSGKPGDRNECRVEEQYCSVGEVHPAVGCQKWAQNVPTYVSVEPPLLELKTLYVSAGMNDTIGCVIALRTTAGWFVTPPSEVACREPSYTELKTITASMTDGVAVIELDMYWRTKGPYREDNPASEAGYTLMAFCGVRDGVPACTPLFLGKCDADAPVIGCDKDFEISWTLADNILTLKGTRKIDNHDVPIGAHSLL